MLSNQCILKAQQEQKKTFNHRRVTATDYKIGDLVAIKRTQFLPLSYCITARCGPNRYEVWKWVQISNMQKLVQEQII